jgi:putative phage-type endonuclease
MNPPTYHTLDQGTPEWHALRCGIVTASTVKALLTSKGAIANNDTARMLIKELAAQRISQYVEPQFMTADMMRGHEDEIDARALYSVKYAPVEQTGFVTREIAPGVILGASPDGLVGEDGLIECKSRRQKFQLDTIASAEVPEEYHAQIQAQLLVTGRKWCDFISYCGGWPMFVKRVEPDATLQAIIAEAVIAAEQRIQEITTSYAKNAEGLHMTERREEGEIE